MLYLKKTWPHRCRDTKLSQSVALAMLQVPAQRLSSRQIIGSLLPGLFWPVMDQRISTWRLQPIIYLEACKHPGMVY